MNRTHLAATLAMALTNIAFAGDKDFVDGFVSIPSAVMNTVGDLLPEQSSAGAAFVSASYSPNLVISEPAKVRIIFVWEGAGYRNTLGYFTWRLSADGSTEIVDRQLILPNASFPGAGTMKSGDASTLRDATGAPRVFQPGDRIGFFIIADGFGTNPVKNFSPLTSNLPAPTPAENAKIGKGLFTTLEALNPEMLSNQPTLARHVAMLEMPPVNGFLEGKQFFLVGMEDLNRAQGSDDDFNDLVFIVESTPETAILESDVFTYAPGDPDHDGVTGVADHYPSDPSRATIVRVPESGFGVIGFEDNYPQLGDGDYNDSVVAYRYELVLDSTGRLKDLLATYHLLARGAGYDHVFGLHLPAIPAGTQGSLHLERFDSDPNATPQATSSTIEEVLKKAKSRVIVFPSTKKAMPPADTGNWVNTTSQVIQRAAASARVLLSFNTALPLAPFGSAPFDVWFGIPHGSQLYDVHFAGFPGFSDRPPSLPIESGPQAFVGADGYPWMIQVPFDWPFPLETVLIDQAYPDFTAWRQTKGVANSDWYNKQKSNKTGLKAPKYLLDRPFKLDLPAP